MFFEQHLFISSEIILKVVDLLKKSGHEDGRGIEWGDHFLLDKFIKRTFEL